MGTLVEPSRVWPHRLESKVALRQRMKRGIMGKIVDTLFIVNPSSMDVHIHKNNHLTNTKLI